MKQIDCTHLLHEVMIMTFTQLQVFAKVVDTRSFTKTGELLNMTQSAVSHAVASLEAELGVQMLIRDRKDGIMVSEFGNRVLEPVRDILGRMAQIEQEASAAKGLETGIIRIGSFPSAAARLLPKMIAAFKSLHPKIEVVFFEGTDREVLDWLDARIIDVGFVAQKGWDSQTIPLTRDQMVVVMPQGHPLRDAPTIAVPALMDSPFIMSHGGCEPLIREIFSRNSLVPNIRFEVADTTTILNMVKEGLGITVVPQLSLPDFPLGIEIRELNPPFWRHVGLRYLFEKETPRIVKAFVDTAQLLFRSEPIF